MKRPILPTVLLVAAASAALAFTAGRAAPPVPVIAFVDMSKVIEALDENATVTKEVNDFGERLTRDLEAEKKKIDDEIEAAKLMPEGPERRAKQEDLAHRSIILGANRDVSKRRYDMRKVSALHELYLKVDQAAEELAKKSGYTMVLASDEEMNIPKDSMEAFQQAAAIKRALYIDPRHDITQELISYMNNQWAKAGGKPAPRAEAGSAGKPAADAKKK